MPSPYSFRRLLPLWFFLGGILFSVALAALFQDPLRPSTIQDRADRLAAANYRSGTFTAALPPLPEHWGQLLTAPSAAHTDHRYAVPREASALLIAACGGNPLAAGVVAFSAAAISLAWAASPRTKHPWVTTLLLASALFTIAKTRDWHLADPFPFLPLSGGALILGGWIRREEDGAFPISARVAICGGSALLLLCSPLLALAAVAAVGFASHQRGQKIRLPSALSLRPWLAPLVILIVALAFLAVRNLGTTGHLLTSPSADYAARFTTAPVWTWQSIRMPMPITDPVIERYDELYAIPAAVWTNPVVLQWFDRAIDGAQYAGGLVLALAALITAVSPAGRPLRLAIVLVPTLFATAFTRFEFPVSWWTMLCPALVLLAQEGANTMASVCGANVFKRSLAVGVVLQALALPKAPAWRPQAIQYTFGKNLAEIEAKIGETQGKHLVFASLEPDSDGTLEPADLPREWDSKHILIARDLGVERNRRLIAAMPDRIPWRIVILDRRIGLQRLDRKETAGPAATPAQATPTTSLSP